MLRFNQTFNVLKRILCETVDLKLSVVYLSTSQPTFNRGRRSREPNPGLDKRLNLFNEDKSNKNNYDLLFNAEIDDEMEADFMKLKEENVHSTYDRQKVHTRESLKRNIIKQKYFKTKSQSNFLTWAEKEQIRHLHRSDAVEWSTEKLSQSFPASEIVIKKIIKSCWEQEDLSKIMHHDCSVQNNWKELLGGRMIIDQELKEHLMKFAKRNQAGLAHSYLKNINYIESGSNSVENVEGEFSGMVLACRGEVKNTRQLQLPAVSTKYKLPPDKYIKSERSRVHDADTFVLEQDGSQSTRSNKLVTLDQYKQAFNLNGVHSKENIAVKNHSEDIDEMPVVGIKPAIKLLGHDKLETSGYLEYPEHIHIPKNKWKEGGTYKSGDCYYDDDGEFLYRVPGMK